jgi:hypothetical protein
MCRDKADKAAQKTEIDKEVKSRIARYPAAYILGDFLSPPLPREVVCHGRQMWRLEDINCLMKQTNTNFM